jgi:hypothetical protein
VPAVHGGRVGVDVYQRAGSHGCRSERGEVKKGPLFESQVVAFLQEHGFPFAERRVMGGSRDRGDVAGIPGLVIEDKNSPEYLRKLASWLDEANEEAANADAIGVVWHKRQGKGSPGDCYVTMDGRTFVELLKAWAK